MNTDLVAEVYDLCHGGARRALRNARTASLALSRAFRATSTAPTETGDDDDELALALTRDADPNPGLAAAFGATSTAR